MRNKVLQRIAVAAVLASGWYYALAVIQGNVEAAGFNNIMADLSPAWVASRAFLFHGQSPYSEEVMREAQRLRYGEVLGKAHLGRMRDQQRFAYPLFAVLFVAPLAPLSFPVAQIVAFWILLLLSVATIWLWSKFIGVNCSLAGYLLILAMPAVSMGIVCRQPTVLCLFLLAAAAYSVKAGRYELGGLLLALAMIKPHLAAVVFLPILFWSLADWKRRKTAIFSFAITLAVLISLSFIMLPGWFQEWRATVSAYQQYANETVPPLASHPLLGAALVLATGGLIWPFRDDLEFALVLSTAASQLWILIVPFQAYNLPLLLPAAFWMWQGRRRLIESRLTRIAWRFGLSILALSLTAVAVAATLHLLRMLPLSVALLPISIGDAFLFVPPLTIAAYLLTQRTNGPAGGHESGSEGLRRLSRGRRAVCGPN